jgi:hypothetical protein
MSHGCGAGDLLLLSAGDRVEPTLVGRGADPWQPSKDGTTSGEINSEGAHAGQPGGIAKHSRTVLDCETRSAAHLGPDAVPSTKRPAGLSMKPGRS